MLDIVIEARRAAISESVMVKRILPFRLRRMVGPFIFMDHAGPTTHIPANPRANAFNLALIDALVLWDQVVP